MGMSSRDSLAIGFHDNPYRLHAHCSKHNTVLSLCRDLPVAASGGRETLASIRNGTMGSAQSDGPMDASVYGNTVARVSCGQVGFRKAQRSTFEAATRATNKMLDLIDGLSE